MHALRVMFLRPVWLVCAALVLSGCAQTSDGRTVTIIDDIRTTMRSDEGLNPREKVLLERAKKYANWRIEAAAGGAILGALTGVLIGGDDHAGAGAVIGGLSGAQLGYLAGAYIGELNKQAEDRRATLNGQLEASRATLAETRDSVAITRQMVQEERKKIADLNREYKAGQIQKAGYEAQIKTLKKKLAMTDEVIRAADGDILVMEELAKKHREEHRNPARLESDIKRMKAELAKLRELRAQLVASIGTIPDGIKKPKVSDV